MFITYFALTYLINKLVFPSTNFSTHRHKANVKCFLVFSELNSVRLLTACPKNVVLRQKYSYTAVSGGKNATFRE